MQRLRRMSAHSTVIPCENVKCYVNYANTYVSPTLSRGAAKVLQRYYLELRAAAASARTIPVTARSLESLIRLSQARAKMELREEVTAEDAAQVVDLVEQSIMRAMCDMSNPTMTSTATARSASAAATTSVVRGGRISVMALVSEEPRRQPS